MKSKAIEFKNVSYVRDGNVILNSIDLEIEDNENVAVIGPNGSGKTSIMKLLSGDVRPYSDPDTVCRLFGETHWNLFDIRSKMGLVSMDIQTRFSASTSVREAILSGFFRAMDVYRNHDVTSKMIAECEQAAESMELQNKLSRDLGKLSLGEMRRTLIARALVSRPRVLVMDEPMTGLDVIAKHDFRTMFDLLMTKGTDIIMITHELEDIPSSVDRVVMVKNGRIFMDGRKEELLTSETVSELYDRALNVDRRSGTYHMYVEE